LAEVFSKASKGAQNTFLQYGLSILREALISTSSANDGLLRVEGQEKSFVANFGKALSVDQIQIMADHLSEAIYHLERNASAKILFINLSINLSRAIKSN